MYSGAHLTEVQRRQAAHRAHLERPRERLHPLVQLRADGRRDAQVRERRVGGQRARDGGHVWGLGYLRRKIAEKSQYWWELVYHRARVLTCSAYRLAGLHLPMSLRYFQMDEAHRRAIARYVFTPYAGKVTLMRAIDRGPEALGKREDPAQGWGTLAEGGLQIYNIPTQHMYMLFEPYVGTFAETLKTILPH